MMDKLYILNKEYMNIDMSKIDTDDFEKLGEQAVGHLSEVGAQTLITMAEEIVQLIDIYFDDASDIGFKENLRNSYKHGICVGIIHFGRSYDYWDVEPSSEEKKLLFYISALAIANTEQKYIKDDFAQWVINKLAKLKYPKAKEYLKYGTGKIDRQYTYLKQPLVECNANDATMVVEFKIKEECAEAYSVMLRFITNALKHGFPFNYKIKFNSKIKNYVNIGTKNTPMNQFFTNASQYPELYDIMKDYAHQAFSEFQYYSDADTQQAVSCGGYAAMSLAFADLEKNFDIAVEFIENSDLEHALTTRYFIRELLNHATEVQKSKLMKYLK